MARYNIRLSGSGGQGMITAGIILAMAASIYGDKNATQSQSYGPEARGGASKAEVIISDDEINYPKVMAPKYLVALTQEAADKYSTDLEEGGIIIVDSMMVKSPPKGNFEVYSLPIVKAAAERAGKSMVANIVTLAALNDICKFVSEEELEQAVLARVPKGTEDLNKKALEVGKALVAENA